MIFSKGVIPLGRGRVTSAVCRGGDFEFLCAVDGAIVKRCVKSGKRVVSGNKIVSYADECFFLGGGFVERKGDDVTYAIEIA